VGVQWAAGVGIASEDDVVFAVCLTSRAHSASPCEANQTCQVGRAGSDRTAGASRAVSRDSAGRGRTLLLVSREGNGDADKAVSKRALGNRSRYDCWEILRARWKRLRPRIAATARR
jgi:hypothetical protein